MRFEMGLRCQTFVVLCYAVLTIADKDVKNIKVTPTTQNKNHVVDQNFITYAFRPRAIPLKIHGKPTPSAEKPVYYTQDNKYKTEILFPGNYFTIPKEKSKDTVEDSAYNPLVGGQFEPTAIPLLRGQGFAKRSLDLDDVSTENPKELVDQAAQRRSLSYILGEAEEEDDEEGDGEYEVEEPEELEADGLESKHKYGSSHHAHRLKKKAKRTKKYSKYMMPLLLAYKLKYFAIIPVMIGGLVLLVGATGLAGFFFALFAAVMGLQKGGY
ncbi:uncharacterized protein LOC116774789 [Danaus plexippus]|uniref:uncharacterized protein LOC116774789 n=1 Tax=Danaus plexippus TaxID=13037 RepID=UPI002AB011E4|nr:uncharacterized protein LOC116774789 [Danaus plexippus]